MPRYYSSAIESFVDPLIKLGILWIGSVILGKLLLRPGLDIIYLFLGFFIFIKWLELFFRYLKGLSRVLKEEGILGLGIALFISGIFTLIVFVIVYILSAI